MWGEGYINRLTSELAQPLGLDCEFGFSSEDVVRYINRRLLVLDETLKDDFKDHLDNCVTCLLRIVFLIRVRIILFDLIGNDDIRQGLYIKLFDEALERLEALPIVYPSGWTRKRYNCFGDTTRIWLDRSRLCIETSRASERSPVAVIRIGSLALGAFKAAKRRAFQPDCPCITIRYPDPVTAILIRILSSS